VDRELWDAFTPKRLAPLDHNPGSDKRTRLGKSIRENGLPRLIFLLPPCSLLHLRASDQQLCEFGSQNILIPDRIVCVGLQANFVPVDGPESQIERLPPGELTDQIADGH
jgi:hypothetical protein